MATKATIYKMEIEISDVDRSYYATHNLTIAQHPSETERRLMARVLAFAILAEEDLEFGKGVSTEDEPDLWRRDLTGRVLQWIVLGQPDESDIRKACGRADQVVIVNYSGNSAEVWWSKIEPSLAKLKNLTVIDLPSEAIERASRLVQRTMRMQVMVQEGELQLMHDDDVIRFQPQFRLEPKT